MSDAATKGRGRRASNGPRQVADLMRHDVITIGPDASIGDLVRTLSDHGISGMPVVADDGRVLGTVSSTDLLWFADGVADESARSDFLPAEVLDTRVVRDIMTPDVFGVQPATDLVELRRFFARTGVHRAPVIADGRVVGIVSLSDVLGTLVS